MEKKIVIFVSGNGSNMENIIQYFQEDALITVSRVFTNKSTCGAIDKANKHNIPVTVFTKEDLNQEEVLTLVNKEQPSLIVLAGFLLKVPEAFTQAFKDRIINIHPSLLPKYGGKGMYGKHVHKAVIENQEEQSGITIHFVNEHYDEGNIISQHSCSLTKKDTVESLQEKIHALEMQNFPIAIKKLLS